MSNLICPECGKKFKNKQTLARHQRKFHKPKPKTDKSLYPPSKPISKGAIVKEERQVKMKRRRDLYPLSSRIHTEKEKRQLIRKALQGLKYNLKRLYQLKHISQQDVKEIFNLLRLYGDNDYLGWGLSASEEDAGK